MSNAELKLKASSLGLKNYLRVSPEVLEKAVLVQEFINQFKEEEDDEMIAKITEIVGEIGETAIPISSESVLDEILALCSDSTSDDKEENTLEEEKEEEVNDNKEEAVVVEKEKKEKTSSVEKGPGVIASILEFIKEAPCNRIEILTKLKTRFPDRDEESMSKTLKVQIEGKSPTRLEKEKNVKLTIKGEGITRTYNIC